MDFESEQYLRHQRRTRPEHEDGGLEGVVGVQKPQTLDEWHYGNLKEAALARLAKDQVVYKWFKHLSSSSVTNGKSILPGRLYNDALLPKKVRS